MSGTAKTLLAAFAGGVLGASTMIPVTKHYMRAGGGSVTQNVAETALAANRDKVEAMVLEDVEMYGMDVYRLYLEISQSLPGMPGEDFAVDKALKKLAVTYPNSNARRLADAYVVYGAIRRRDMMQIEQYLEAAEQSGEKHLLMPNGYEIIPQLIAAQYNYYFHIGRLDEAGTTLTYLEANFRDGYIFQPQGKPIAVVDFIANQRRVLEIIKGKVSK